MGVQPKLVEEDKKVLEVDADQDVGNEAGEEDEVVESCSIKGK